VNVPIPAVDVPMDSPSSAPPPRRTRYRWVICALLFYATTLNYMDRSTFGVIAPTLQAAAHIDEAHYGYIVAAFSVAYGIGLLFAGRIIDAIGTRLGYALALVVWSASAAATALTRTPLQVGAARFMLGLGESGNFPAAIKTVAEWFPQRERASATGIFNAGSNIGAIAAPLVVPFVVFRYGWPAAFLVTPCFALIWVALWLAAYRRPAEHRRVNAAELAHIRGTDASTGPSTSVPWRFLLVHPQAYAIMVGKFLTDPVWWFYLYWSGKFFHDRFHTDLKGTAWPLVLIYVMADVGSIGGGLLSSQLIGAGLSANVARKAAMSLCAVLIVPVSLAPVVPGMWTAAMLIGLAAAAHQGFSANLMTLPSDLFPRRAVASVAGLAGFCGAVGGMLAQVGAGHLLQNHGSRTGYFVAFLAAACLYLVAVPLIHMLSPRLKPAVLADPGDRAFPVVFPPPPVA
jgi:ACS family hexuronate transporter-like MFS transporter